MIETFGLSHLHLAVRDLQRSLRFYCGVFGMQERIRVGPDMIFLSTPGAEDLITLHQVHGSETVGGGGIAHFGFRLKRRDDLDRAVTEVVAAGGRLIERGEHAPDQPYAYVADPDGYTIEL